MKRNLSDLYEGVCPIPKKKRIAHKPKWNLDPVRPITAASNKSSISTSGSVLVPKTTALAKAPVEAKKSTFALKKSVPVAKKNIRIQNSEIETSKISSGSEPILQKTLLRRFHYYVIDEVTQTYQPSLKMHFPAEFIPNFSQFQFNTDQDQEKALTAFKMIPKDEPEDDTNQDLGKTEVKDDDLIVKKSPKAEPIAKNFQPKVRPSLICEIKIKKMPGKDQSSGLPNFKVLKPGEKLPELKKSDKNSENVDNFSESGENSDKFGKMNIFGKMSLSMALNRINSYYKSPSSSPVEEKPLSLSTSTEKPAKIVNFSKSLEKSKSVKNDDKVEKMDILMALDKVAEMFKSSSNLPVVPLGSSKSEKKPAKIDKTDNFSKSLEKSKSVKNDDNVEKMDILMALDKVDEMVKSSSNSSEKEKSRGSSKSIRKSSEKSSSLKDDKYKRKSNSSDENKSDSKSHSHKKSEKTRDLSKSDQKSGKDSDSKSHKKSEKSRDLTKSDRKSSKDSDSKSQKSEKSSGRKSPKESHLKSRASISDEKKPRQEKSRTLSKSDTKSTKDSKSYKKSEKDLKKPRYSSSDEEKSLHKSKAERKSPNSDSKSHKKSEKPSFTKSRPSLFDAMDQEVLNKKLKSHKLAKLERKSSDKSSDSKRSKIPQKLEKIDKIKSDDLYPTPPESPLTPIEAQNSLNVLKPSLKDSKKKLISK